MAATAPGNFNEGLYNSLFGNNNSMAPTNLLAGAPAAPIKYTTTHKTIINELPKVSNKNSSYFLKKEKELQEKYRDLHSKCTETYEVCLKNVRTNKQYEYNELQKEKKIFLKGGKRHSTSKSKKSKYRKTRK